LTSIPQTIQDDYNNKTYDEISREFQTLFSNAMRAFQLVPLMYNRLTLVDKLSHSQAVKKIHHDHSHLEGFSSRSIRRCLPPDNPTVPRRVRPSWPKNSDTQTDGDVKLSNDEQYEKDVEKEGPSITDSRFPNKPESSTITSENLELAGVQRIEDEKQQLAEQVTILQKLHIRDRAKIKDLEEVVSNGSSVVAEQILSKTSAAGGIISFEFSFEFEQIKQHVSSITTQSGPIDKLWFNGSFNKDKCKVIEISLGRLPANNAKP
jgi:hypothetical protein